MHHRYRRTSLVLALFAAALSLHCGLFGDRRTVPHEGRFGIYSLDLATGDIMLAWSTDEYIDGLTLDPAGSRFAFSQRVGANALVHEEICTVGIDGAGYARLTTNGFLDTYPAWSPDGTRLMYLSWPDSTLDIWLMDSGGANARLLFDSGSHDADISWVGDAVAFTTGSRVWLMNCDGTGAHRVTDPPRAGEWGNAVLPFGDYDPRIRPDGSRIVFERLVDDASGHGNYDIYVTPPDGAWARPLTSTAWTQGTANWSRDGRKLTFIVSVQDGQGTYDIWLMNEDGTDRRNVMPAYAPAEFLCHSPLFSPDGNTIWFIGEWWQ